MAQHIECGRRQALSILGDSGPDWETRLYAAADVLLEAGDDAVSALLRALGCVVLEILVARGGLRAMQVDPNLLAIEWDGIWQWGYYVALPGYPATPRAYLHSGGQSNTLAAVLSRKSKADLEFLCESIGSLLNLHQIEYTCEYCGTGNADQVLCVVLGTSTPLPITDLAVQMSISA